MNPRAILSLTLLLGVPFLARSPALGSSNFAQNGRQMDQPPLTAPNKAFPLGEHLVYDISWVGIPIGRGELWVKELMTLKGRAVFHVVGKFDTNDFLSKIYPVHDEIHSWIDVHSLQSLQFEKSISEGEKRAHEVAVFEKPTHDVLSSFYWVRRQSLVPGSSAEVVMSVDGTEWTLEAVVLDRRWLQLRKRARMDTLLVEPRSRANGVEKKGKSLIDFTADASRKPFHIKYKAPFGWIVGILV